MNTVSWVAPASNGSSITGYTVEFVQKTSGVWGQTWQQACTGGALDTSCEHTGLSQGDEYKYRIIATNGEGSSPASSESLEQAVVAGVPEALFSSHSVLLTEPMIFPGALQRPMEARLRATLSKPQKQMPVGIMEHLVM